LATIEKSIEVNVPVETAYNQWTQFEEFPNFMEGVQEVQQIDESLLYWAADIGGTRKEWYARITRQVPDQIIAWESEEGVMNAGVVTFRPSPQNTTEIQLQMEYEPESFKENVGDVLGVVSRRVEGDLRRFKEYIETRGLETGAWRGTIPNGGEAHKGGNGTDTMRYGASGQGGAGYGGTREGGTYPGSPGQP
jgi:uncharacterized membrane protein